MAGVELATAYYSLVPSMSGTAAAVRSQSAGLAGVWGGIGDDAGKGLRGGLVGGIAGAGASIVGALAVLGIGNLIGDAVRTGVDFAMDGISIASDLSETRSAIEQVFGAESLSALNSWADGSATAIGQSELAALQAAQSFGVYGQAAGLAGGDLVTFSTDLATLGGDLASFFGGSPEDAIYAIGAGLRGESEPLRKYGVLLDDATLKARAMSMGIFDGVGSLTAQQRVLAAQAEIMSQAAIASGDFERTSGSLANQQRTLAANFENSKAALGEALLPAMTQLVTFANTTLVPMLNTLVTAVGPVLSEALTQAGPAFTDLLTAIIPLMPELVRAGGELLPALASILIVLSPLLVDLATNTASLFANMNAFLSWLAGDTTFTEFMGVVGDAGGSVSDFGVGVGNVVTSVAGFFQSMAASISASITAAIAFVLRLPSSIMSGLAGAGSWLVRVGADMIAGFISGVRSMASRVLSVVTDVIGGAVNWAKDLLGIASPSKVFTVIGMQTAEGYNRGITKMQPKVDTTVAHLVAPPKIETSSEASSGQDFPFALMLQTLREIRDVAGITVPVPAVQGALSSRNVGVSIRGQA
jgi:hypothetical protein